MIIKELKNTSHMLTFEARPPYRPTTTRYPRTVKGEFIGSKLNSIGDAPAIVLKDGSKYWYKNDLRHRTTGPAVINPDGGEEYWVDGVQYSKEEYKKKVRGV